MTKPVCIINYFKDFNGNLLFKIAIRQSVRRMEIFVSCINRSGFMFAFLLKQ